LHINKEKEEFKPPSIDLIQNNKVNSLLREIGIIFKVKFVTLIRDRSFVLLVLTSLPLILSEILSNLFNYTNDPYTVSLIQSLVLSLLSSILIAE
jgi:hypothetical protein